MTVTHSAPTGDVSPIPRITVRRQKGSKEPAIRMSLALQGGGAFGAFTWGVLDRLLQEESVFFDAVSGASAGAMNAVVLAAGLAEGGREGARACLERFWSRVSRTGRRTLFASCDTILSTVAQTLSPYQLNPLDVNPLRDILAAEVDFDRIQRGAPLRLLLGATRVSDGALRIFRNRQITQEVVLASACLPHLHQAVSIAGEPHWDGGYAANPPVLPLVKAMRAADLMVVQIMPENYTELPTTSAEIDKRLSQITFNNSLQKDLEALAVMKELCKGGRGNGTALGRKLCRMKLHHLSAEAHVDNLSGLSFKNTDWSFLTELRDRGRQAADGWLESRGIGVRASAEH